MKSKTSAVVVSAAVVALVAMPCLAGAERETGGKAPPTVIAIPFGAAGEAPDWTGVAVAEVVNDAVVQADRDNFLTLKQLDAVLRRRALRLNDGKVSTEALDLSRAVGATDSVTGTVSLQGKDVKLTGEWKRTSDGAEVNSAKVEGPMSALPELSEQLAEKLLGTKKMAPATKSEKALELAAKCAVELDRQSVSPRAKVTLAGERLEAADKLCQDAVEADRKFGLAHAYEAILLSLRNHNDDALKEAKLSETFKRYVPIGALAEAFAERRAGNVEGARKALEEAVKERPGFLHAIGYLAEEQEDLNHPEEALKWWRVYLARSPGHPFATAGAGRALTKLGKTHEGIALTEQALERSPNDPELLVELADRYIEANEMGKAEEILKGVQQTKPSRALAWLRLGYLYMKEGKYEQAGEEFVEAAKIAQAEDEARVRAMAYADLAQVDGQEGKYDEAVKALASAAKEGMHKLPCDSAELVKFKGKTEFDQTCARAAEQPGGLNDDEDVVAIEMQ